MLASQFLGKEQSNNWGKIELVGSTALISALLSKCGLFVLVRAFEGSFHGSSKFGMNFLQTEFLSKENS